ncbi:MAG: SRPBCC domain-containing protein [Bryobacteraceae bacterium]|jgi:hypothetical protein
MSVQDIEIPAPAEDVWKTITAASEIRRWSAPEVRTDPHEGGEYLVSRGLGIPGTIEVSEAPDHLRVVSGRGEPPVLLTQDFYIEAKGDLTVLRLVHSESLDTADWDDGYNGTKADGPVHFQILRLALTRCCGVSALNIDLCAFSSEPVNRVWEMLAPLRPSQLGGGKPNQVWWIWPEQNNATVHLSCSSCGPKTRISLGVKIGLPGQTAEGIPKYWNERLHGIFPEQTSGTCA